MCHLDNVADRFRTRYLLCTRILWSVNYNTRILIYRNLLIWLFCISLSTIWTDFSNSYRTGDVFVVVSVLLKPAEKELFRERLKNPNMPYLSKKGLKKKILGKPSRVLTRNFILFWAVLRVRFRSTHWYWSGYEFYFSCGSDPYFDAHPDPNFLPGCGSGSKFPPWWWTGFVLMDPDADPGGP
jgi:hypothetical protein